MVGDEQDRSVTKDGKDEQRVSLRQTVFKSGKIVFGDAVIDCMLVNVSDTGVRVRTAVMTPIPEHVTLRFSGGAVYRAYKRWARGTDIGFSFDGTASLTQEQVAIAWHAYEQVRRVSIEEVLRILRVSRFFDDPALQKSAEGAESALRQLEGTLASRARLQLS